MSTFTLDLLILSLAVVIFTVGSTAYDSWKDRQDEHK